MKCALILLGRFGFVRSGLRAKLKTMAAEEQKNVLEHSPEAGAQENPSEVLSDGELVTDKTNEGDTPADLDLSAFEAHEQLSEHEVFAGDEDFYELLADSARDDALQTVTRQLEQDSDRHKRFSSLQKILAVSIVAVVSMLLYVFLKYPSGVVTSPTPAFPEQAGPAARQAPTSGSPATIPIQQVAQEQIQESEPLLSPGEPLSLKVARSFYLQKDYDKAYAAYNQLRQALPASEELLRDFLQLKMALSAKEAA
ncbi:MAG: hypothetical protein ACYTFW_14060, partial [Planctomycetota bacterium]